MCYSTRKCGVTIPQLSHMKCDVTNVQLQPVKCGVRINRKTQDEEITIHSDYKSNFKSKHGERPQPDS